MDWLMKYGAKAFAVLTLLAAAWPAFGGKVTTLQIIVLVLAALTVLTLFLPQHPKVTVSTVTPPK